MVTSCHALKLNGPPSFFAVNFIAFLVIVSPLIEEATKECKEFDVACVVYTVQH